MGYKYYPFSQTQGYTPATCATACTAQNAYNKAYPAVDGTYQTCVSSSRLYSIEGLHADCYFAELLQFLRPLFERHSPRSLLQPIQSNLGPIVRNELVRQETSASSLRLTSQPVANIEALIDTPSAKAIVTHWSPPFAALKDTRPN